MPRWMTAIAITGAVGIAITGEWRAAAGFALGAGLGILGYLWLHETVHALLGANRKPRWLAAKLTARYALMAGLIAIAHRTGWAPVLAIFAALLVPGAGVLLESLNLIAKGLRTDH